MLHHGGRSFASAWSKAASFYPANLGSLLYADWDAELPGTLTLATSAVTTWTDCVRGIAATQSGGATLKPAWSATSFNGRPGVTFDGTDDFLEAASPNLPAAAVECELWGLVSQDQLAGVAGALTFFGYGANNATRLIQRNVSGGVNRALGVTGTGAAAPTVADTTVDFSGIHVVRGRFTAATTYISVDGGTETSAAIAMATTATRLRIGANSNATVAGYFKGVVNRLLCTAPLDTTQAALLTAFLKARGGLP